MKIPELVRVIVRGGRGINGGNFKETALHIFGYLFSTLFMWFAVAA